MSGLRFIGNTPSAYADSSVLHRQIEIAAKRRSPTQKSMLCADAILQFEDALTYDVKSLSASGTEMTAVHSLFKVNRTTVTLSGVV